MPLHDWSSLLGWNGVHQIWTVELLHWIKPRLPAGYRVYIGTTPTFAVGAAGDVQPDVVVREWSTEQEIAVDMLESERVLFVEHQDRLIAAVELVSPRNKDRQSACTAYTSTYAAYLLKEVHLLLVDVQRRPLQFSFANRIAEELDFEQPPCPAPFAISYRVGEPAPRGGRFLGIWRRPLTVAAPLATIPLPLSVKEAVLIDLEQTYSRAAAAAYLS